MVIVHVFIDVLPECIDAFVAATDQNARHSRQEAGIARFELLASTDHPSRFLLVEAYRTVEARASHKDSAHFRAWVDAVAPMMASPRRAEVYRTAV